MVFNFYKRIQLSTAGSISSSGSLKKTVTINHISTDGLLRKSAMAVFFLKKPALEISFLKKLH